MDHDPSVEQLTIVNAHILHRIDLPHEQAERGQDSGRAPYAMGPRGNHKPPCSEPVPRQDLHPFLRKFGDEHVAFLQELNAFEEAIFSIQRNGYTREFDARLRHFFHFLDEEFFPHSRREEVTLFPLLRERLIASGEHGNESVPARATDLMEDEHAKAMQLAAVVLNFLGLVFRLPDERSGMIVLDAVLEQSKNLIELLRFHVFREDSLVFPLAHRLIIRAEFDAMQAKAGLATSST